MRGLGPLAICLLLAAGLAGCGAPKQPQQEVLGSTGLLFPVRPSGSLDHLDVVWTLLVLNNDTATSAAATAHLTIHSSRTGMTNEGSAQVPPLAPQATTRIQVRTPYDGTGDYSGTAELLVGDRVVQRAFVFFEQCPPTLAC